MSTRAHSLIIPTAGRTSQLDAALRSVVQLGCDNTQLEVLVIDNNSDTEDANKVLEICSRFPVRYIREPSPGLTAARHRGVAEAKHERLSFLDDDIELSSGWLEAIADAFDDPSVAMVGGPSIPRFTGHIPEWFWDFIAATPYGGWSCTWLSLLDIGRDVDQIDPNWIWGLNFSIRRDVLENCHGFHIDLVPNAYLRWQGDGETGLTMKVKTAGFRAVYRQAAMVFHQCGADRLNMKYFAKRAYYQGVCNSFSLLRRTHQPSQELPEQLVQRSISARILSRIRRSLPLPHSKQVLVSPWRADASEVKQQCQVAESQGFQFHQAEVEQDPVLMAWVCRPHFMDVDLDLEFRQYQERLREAGK